jgi:hypothetical protein
MVQGGQTKVLTVSLEDLMHAFDRHAAFADRSGQRLTEPERTSAAAKIPGQFVPGPQADAPCSGDRRNKH